MLSDLILALGLVLSPSSQFRLPNLPVGPGELCFILWLFLALFREIRRGRFPLTGALSRLLVFWTLFGLALSIGAIGAAVTGDRQDPELVMHDVVAYSLLVAVSICSVLGPDARWRLHRVAWLAVALGTISLFLQLLQAWDVFDLPMFDPWYWDRLTGWSQNPNQLGFMCAALSLTSLYLIDQSSGLTKRTLLAISAVITIITGRLTHSDSYTLALFVGLLTFLGIKIWTWIRSAGIQLTLRSGLSWIAVVSASFLLTVGLGLSPLIADEAKQMAMSLAKNGGVEAAAETDLRVFLWLSAISRGLDSGLLGLGPGPHLEIPESLVLERKTEKEPKYVRHPDDNGTANFESHNTYLESFVQGGAIALICLLGLMGTCLSNTFRTREASLAAMLCGLAAFGMTTVVTRQPFFWFTIALCLLSGRPQELLLPLRNKTNQRLGGFRDPLSHERLRS
jgi:O-antigen ligase